MQSKRFIIDKTTEVRVVLAKIDHFVEPLMLDPIGVTEVVTVCSELIYNIIKYAQCGEIHLEASTDRLIITSSDISHGLKLPVEKAFIEGVSSSGSLGLGMTSMVRMCDEFSLTTNERGTTIICEKLFKS